MQHLTHTLVRFYPYWALVVSFILVELAIFFRRRRQFASTAGCLFFAVLFFLGICSWFYFRGDLHSDRWVKDWFASDES